MGWFRTSEARIRRRWGQRHGRGRGSDVIAITLHDLRYRARQFLIAVLGASLVFAMSLLLSGLAAGFSVEVDQTVGGTGAAAWVMAKGSPGRATSLPPITAAQATAAAVFLKTHGVKTADPVVIAPEAATVGSKIESIVLVGYRPGGLGEPPPRCRQIHGTRW
jgi:putative ABC transport system permease protein